MDKLINCIECNRKFSSNLKQCPHCKTEYPRGLNCIICGGFGKLSDMNETVSGHGWPERYHHHYAHKACIAKVKHEFESGEHRFICPTCKNVTVHKANFDDNEYRTACANCGEKLEIYSRCPFCKYIVFTQNAVTYKGSFAHRFCYNKYTICFIATASCGADSLEVVMLRKFRDAKLSSNPIGHILIIFYEFLSPPIAKAILKNAILRNLVRKAIENLVNIIAKPLTNSN